MSDSTALPQIVKTMMMAVKFHPLLTVTNFIIRLIFLQDWIEEETSNQWKALKVYCQLTMRALVDSIIEKMKNLSEALQIHLNKEATKGQPKAKLIGKIALYSATFLLLDIRFSSKYYKIEAKTYLLLLTGHELLANSKLRSQFKILHGRCGCMANLTSNFTLFIIALLFANFYNNSLRNLSVMLCIAVFLLCVLVVLQPRTDLGLFSFIIGVIGSITYNRYDLKFPTWIVASICFVLFSFKSWLDEYWLNLEQDQSLTSTNTTMVESNSMFLIFSSIVADTAGAIFLFSVVKYTSPNYKNWLVKAIRIVLWFLQFNKFYPIPKGTPSLSTNTKAISNLSLTIVNIAQGIFNFALITSPIADYKDWLFIVISFVVFCFWLRSCFVEDLSLSSTNTKGIVSMILSLLSIAMYGIVVLVGLEPRLYYKRWLDVVTCYVLWWIRLRTSFPRNLLLPSIMVEFKPLDWWTAVALYAIVQDVISWIKLSRATHHQQLG